MTLGAKLTQAVASRDTAAIEACFADNARFRALVPSGLREREGGVEAAALITAWFADSTELELVDARTDEIADRLYVSYRFQGVEEGKPYVVEQQLYCTVRDGRVERADLLCSGFRPRP